MIRHFLTHDLNIYYDASLHVTVGLIQHSAQIVVDDLSYTLTVVQDFLDTDVLILLNAAIVAYAFVLLL